LKWQLAYGACVARFELGSTAARDDQDNPRENQGT
jgi:hypothetical protein